NDVSILEDPTGRKKVMPRKRESKEVQKAASVQTIETVSVLETSINPSNYAWRKKYLVKEKTPEEEAPEHKEKENKMKVLEIVSQYNKILTDVKGAMENAEAAYDNCVDRDRVT
ncbi:hypothetical protein KI387_012910, partial [Taxus chinensis]